MVVPQVMCYLYILRDVSAIPLTVICTWSLHPFGLLLTVYAKDVISMKYSDKKDYKELVRRRDFLAVVDMMLFLRSERKPRDEGDSTFGLYVILL